MSCYGRCELDSDTGVKAESGDSDLDGLDASEADSVQSDALSVASEPEADVLNYQGPWILNTVTGWFHRSVQCESADSGSMLQIAGAALRAQHLLETRSHAFAMVGACHLHSWVVYVKKFLSLCARKPSDMFRAPTVYEAEMADRAVLDEVFQLIFRPIVR